ncbi:MAG: molybdopterin dinucleotide binding domain-containing protein [Candidatus Bathyarchaeia archaeon]
MTGRSLSQGRSKEQGKLSDLHLQSVACCEINTEDLLKIGVSHGENVCLSTEHGRVVVRAVSPTQPIPPGVVFMPYGLWAAQIVGCDTDGSGMPTCKGISATLSPAIGQDVLKVEELVRLSFGKTDRKNRKLE